MSLGAAPRWLLMFLAIALIVLVPFALWGEQIETWTEEFLESASGQKGIIAVFLAGMLAADIAIPIPNSFISTAAGLFLGFVGGTLVSFVGNMATCVIGYALGAQFGRPVALRFVGEAELERVEKLDSRIGGWAIVVSRALPVLGEASALFAGITRMPMSKFLTAAGLSSLGMSAMYAAAGAFSNNLGSFTYVFLAAVALSAVGMFIASRIEKGAT